MQMTWYYGVLEEALRREIKFNAYKSKVIVLGRKEGPAHEIKVDGRPLSTFWIIFLG